VQLDTDLPGTDGGGEAALQWEPVVSDGFGTANNAYIAEFHSRGGYLYAGTGATNEPGVSTQLWRSTTGDPGTWQRLADFTPALTGKEKVITSFASTDLGGGYLWLGVSGGNGAEFFQSRDGLAFKRINTPGFGIPTNATASPNVVVFDGYLFAGAGSHGGATGAQVWRTPYANADPAGWTLVHDFDSTDKTVTTITYFLLWKGRILFSGSGQLWESSDGQTFTKNPGVGNGFGVPSQLGIASMCDFGGALYVTTTNKTLGGQLWRTADGVKWECVTPDAFGRGKGVEELHKVRAAFGRLWITGYTNSGIGVPVWTSTDGVHFSQCNADGFGNPDNTGPNANTIDHAGYQYVGVPNEVSGGQIWRVRMQPAGG
jgi:hypothetical protein